MTTRKSISHPTSSRTTRSSRNNDWIIAIPSYNRAETLKNKTLATLKHYNIPASKIFVFVANNDEMKLYRDTLDPKSYGKLILGVPGLAEVRNFISNYFPINKKIVSMDDDISGFIEYDESNKRHERPLRSLINIIQTGFRECIKHKCTLWGIYAVPNGFFMKPTITTDLKFIVGNFCGFINPGIKGDKGIKLEMAEKDDYIRSIKAYIRDGCVIRLNYVAPKTSYYKEPGGLQSDPNRVKKQEKAVEWLLKTYPEYVKRNPTRKSGYPEIRIRAPKKSESESDS
jgi:hypothetical protein